MLRPAATLLSLLVFYSGVAGALETCERGEPYSHRHAPAHEHASHGSNADRSHGVPDEIRCSPIERIFVRAAQIAQPCPSGSRVAFAADQRAGLDARWAADELLSPPSRSRGPSFHTDPPLHVFLSVFRI